jgi:hypothetical protein
MGALAIVAIIVGAAFLRSTEAVDALEEQPDLGAAPQAASPSAPAGAGPAAAPTSAPGASGQSVAAGAPQGSAAQGSQAAAPPEAELAIPEAEKATDVELATARGAGSVALEQLLKRYPRDLRVHKALVSAYSIQKNHAGAMAAATRLLGVAPSYAKDSDVTQVIMMAANGPPNASAVALDLMATKMGSRGPDLLYELVTAPRIGKLPRDHAARLLREPAVQKLATPALLIAIDLKNTPPCARKALLARAQDEGDARALAFLKPLTLTTGCGFLKRADCFRCLEPRKDIFEAVAVIQKRLSQIPER